MKSGFECFPPTKQNKDDEQIPKSMVLSRGDIAVCCRNLQRVETHLTSSPASQCVTVCCSVSQCVAVRWGVLQCVTVCCSISQYVAACCSVLQCVAVCCMCCSVLQYVPVLRCVAVCCSVFQCVVVYCSVLQCVVVSCFVLQCVAMCSSELRRTWPRHSWPVLQRVAVCCSVLQYVPSHILTSGSTDKAPHTPTTSTVCHMSASDNIFIYIYIYICVCCSVLQCVAVCCSVLQCAAVCRSVSQCDAV